MVGALKTGLGGLVSLFLFCPTDAFYIPGWSIKSYKQSESIPLLVNKAYSDNTQIQYGYYDLPFVCPPTDRHHVGGGLFSGESIPLNLGEVLRGDRIIVSDIELEMAKDNTCSVLCTRDISRQDLERAQEIARDGYVAEWIVDNLPGATSFVTTDKTRKYYAAGFKLGSVEIGNDKTRYYLNNHYTIVIRYREAPGKAGVRGEKIIVGFEVYPKSVGLKNERDEKGCPVDLDNLKGAFELEMKTKKAVSKPLDPELGSGGDDDGATLSIPYTYSVYFREDATIEWAHRWDLYFVDQEDGVRTHWLSIVNSLIICSVLTSVVMAVLAKTVRTDIKGYKDSLAESGKIGMKRRSAPKDKGLLDQGAELDEGEMSDEDEALDDVTGWKLLHGDVFRTPRFGYLLAPLVGSGVQLLFMAVGLVALSAVGFLNPSYRGGFITVGVGLFIFAGLFSGYFSARVYKSFEGKDYKGNALVTAVLFPGLSFSLAFMLNLFVWSQASSTAMPFGTLVIIMMLWLCVQVPLVYIGSKYGFSRPTWQHPTPTTPIPRQVPPQAWYVKPVQSVLLAGAVPFAINFVELLHMLHSLWEDKSGYYYVFGFLAAVSVILIISIAEVTIISTYAQLCAENYNWWWQSFCVGGGSAVWVFAYSAWYYVFKLHIGGFASGVLFFAYSFMACFLYGLLTGTVGFLCAYAFVRRIYGAIKND